MRTQPLGSTGMHVSRYCLGTMMFGRRGNANHDDAIGIIHAAIDAGINFVDTADVYSSGESEEIVGKALKGRRDEVILATKARNPMGTDPNTQGLSRRWLVQEVEASLRRLQTDWIDLYQMHRPDPSTRIDETLSALSDLIHAGKVRAIGSSSFPADYIVEAQWTSEKRGLERFTCEQSPYSLFARGVERSVLPATMRYDMGVITYGPLDAGWLSGRKNPMSERPTGSTRASGERFDQSEPENAHKLELLGRLQELANELGISLAHLAVGFVTAHPAVTAAIIGPRTMEQLKDLLAGAETELDDAALDRIDEIVPPASDVGAGVRGWRPPWMADASLRRRAAGARSAS